MSIFYFYLSKSYLSDNEAEVEVEVSLFFVQAQTVVLDGRRGQTGSGDLKGGGISVVHVLFVLDAVAGAGGREGGSGDGYSGRRARVRERGVDGAHPGRVHVLVAVFTVLGKYQSVRGRSEGRAAMVRR